MHVKRRIAGPAALLVLLLAALACRGGRPASTSTPPRPTTTAKPTSAAGPTQTAQPETTATVEGESTPQGIVAGTLEVRGVSAYVDTYGYYHVVGEVFNTTEAPAGSLELSLKLVDGSGATVLKDSDDAPTDTTTFPPLLGTLAPGEVSPFDYYLSIPDGAKPDEWKPEVTVSGSAAAEVNRAPIKVVNDRVVADGTDTLYMTGELVNESDHPVLVHSLAGAILNDAGSPAAADAANSYSHYLAPAGDTGGNDRSPFIISLDGPVAGKQSAYYLDADVSDSLDTADSLQLEVVRQYLDEFDRLRLVTTVANTGDKLLSVSLIAGLYDKDGVVLDASELTTAIYVAPGQTVPVTFESFTVNSLPEEQALVDRTSLRVDPYWTYETGFETVALEVGQQDSQVNGAQIDVNGDVTNTSDKDLASATVLMSALDADGKLITSNWASLYPQGDAFKPGDTLPFELSLYLPKDLDPASVKFGAVVQGYVK